MPAVVNIYTSKEMRQRHPLMDDSILRRYFPDLAERMPRQRATSLGSGVIVASEGFVLTNHHVVEGADDIQLVLADGRRIQARVRGTDPDSDLAVLQGRRQGPAGDHLRLARRRAGRRRGAGDRQPLRLRQHGDDGHRQRDSGAITSGSTASRTSSRPTPRSTRATRAARWSTSPATSSASTARSTRSTAARRASASRFPCPSRAPCWSRSSATARSRAAGSASSRRTSRPISRRRSPLENGGGVLIRGIVRGGPADRAGILPRDVVAGDRGQADARHAGAADAHRQARARRAREGRRSGASGKAVDIDVTVGRRPQGRSALTGSCRLLGGDFALGARLARRRRGGTTKRASSMPSS